MNRLQLVIGALVLSSCVVDPVEVPEEIPTARRCPAFGCGVNTATGPDGQFFDELDWTGAQPNDGGVRIASFAAEDGTPLELVVEGDRMVGIDGTGLRYEGTDLEGAVFQMQVVGGTAFEVKIFAVDTVGIAFWAGDVEETVWVYDLLVRKKKGQWGWACRESVTDWIGTPFSAIAFTGDRYDDQQKTVFDGTGTSWFNLACAGSYEAKLHLLRHTWAGGYNDEPVPWIEYPTELWERQAYLKALTGDFFGDGRSFTVSGTPLRYLDALGLHVDSLAGSLIEGAWNENGAVCFEDPRTLLGGLPRVHADVDPVPSQIPRCSAYVGGDNMHVLTAYPP